jgi:O-antigen/teichoic acid export membrane protein
MNPSPSPVCETAGDSGAAAGTPSLAGRVKGLLLGRGDRAVDRGNALIAFVVRVASAVILFASQVLLARWMGAAEYGVYVYAWTVLLVLGGISTVGLNIGAIRIVSESRERRAHEALRGFLRAGRLLVFLAGTLIAVSVGLTALHMSGHYPGGHWIAIAAVMIALPAYALTDVQDGICRGSARILTALLAPYVVRPLLILAGIGTLFAIGARIDAMSAALVAVGATWAAWAFQTVLVTRDMRRIVPPVPRAYETRTWVATTSPLLLMSMFDLIMQHIDIIVISNLLPSAQAGIYFAGAKTMALILFVHYAVGSAMANRFAAIETRGDKEAMRASVRDAVRLTFWPSLAVAAVMLAAGRPLLSLFGPGFVEGFPVMCILAIAIIARAAIGPAEVLLNMTGGQADCARALVIAALANLTLSLILTPLLGIIGAALAVASAMILGAFLNWRAIRRRLGIDAGIWAAHRAPAAGC